MLRKIAQALSSLGSGPRDEWNPWAPLIEREGTAWADALRRAQGGPRVLVAPSMGGFHLGVLLESALAAGLTFRGAAVDLLLCDSALPGCQVTEIANVAPESLLSAQPQPSCAKCERRGRGVFAPLGLETRWLGQLLDREARERADRLAREVPLEGIDVLRVDGMAVGEHARAGALRYFARGDFAGEPAAGEILRLFLRAALLTAFAASSLLRRERYDVACFNHGIYVPQGLLTEACRAHGVRLVTWNAAYRKSSFIFSHHDSYHHTMISEPTADWESMAWSAALERELLEYLESRRRGTHDWIWFHNEPEEEASRIEREIGCNLSRPTVALLTNVLWDAQLHYGSNAFPSMLHWVLETIRYFERRPELQLVIRIHPAELRGGVPSRQLLAPEIERTFPVLPSNVFVVGPDSEVSTYALTERCNAALIYNTKTGIEVSSLGIPVVVAGEAWIRGKGFTRDATSPETYRAILDDLPFASRLTPAEIERARKYAYHFFFRRMIPLSFIEPGEKRGKFALTCPSLAPLRPGVDTGLDVICDGILRESPFIYAGGVR